MSGPVAVGWKGLPTFVLAEANVTVDSGGLVRLPYRLPSGDLYAERVIAPSGRRWWRPGDGRPVIPFGLDRLEDPAFRHYRTLAIAEGESDALALAAMFAAEGMDVLGIPGARTWRPEWADHADSYATVYVFGDGDRGGRELSTAVCRDLPGTRTVELLEGHDVRSLLHHAGPDALAELVDRADVLAVGFEAFMRAATLDEYERTLAA